MTIAPYPKNEAGRLSALESYRLLDTASDPAYDAFARLASEICGTPISLVSLVDSSRQWFKASVGLGDLTETSRDIAFCSHVVAEGATLEISDASQDVRFADNPLVTGDPNLRFYAGVPLVDRDGFALGTLCTLDIRPRELTDKQRTALQHLATSLVSLIEARRGVDPKVLDRLAVFGSAFELAASPIAILTTGAEEKMPIITYANVAFAELFGFAAAEIIGRSMESFAGEKTDRSKLARLLQAAVQGEAGSETLILYRRSGEERIVDVRERFVDSGHRILCLRDLTRVQATQDALSATNHRLQSLLAHNGDAVFTVDRDSACLSANAAACVITGYDRPALLNDGFAKLVRGALFPGGGAFPVALSAGRPITFSTTFEHESGRVLDIDCKAIPMMVHGVAEGAFIVAKDVSESRRLAAFEHEQSERARALYLISASRGMAGEEPIDAALELVVKSFNMVAGFVGEVRGDAIFIRNTVGRALVAAGATLPLNQTWLPETLRRNDVVAVADIGDAELRPAGVPDYPGWHGYICAPLTIDGKPYGAVGFLSTEVTAFTEADCDFMRLVSTLIASEIERQNQRQRLSDLAYHDVLTSLPNRAKFTLELEAAVSLGRRYDRPFALHFIDLDGFKDINDAEGHAAGDAVLVEVAQRLKRTHRAYDAAGRLGGDEFVVLQAEVGSQIDALALADRIVTALGRPYHVDGRRLLLSASVGVSLFPGHGTDANTLLACADAALYRAKTAGKNRAEMARCETPVAAAMFARRESTSANAAASVHA